MTFGCRKLGEKWHILFWKDSSQSQSLIGTTTVKLYDHSLIGTTTVNLYDHSLIGTTTVNLYDHSLIGTTTVKMYDHNLRRKVLCRFLA